MAAIYTSDILPALDNEQLRRSCDNNEKKLTPSRGPDAIICVRGSSQRKWRFIIYFHDGAYFVDGILRVCIHWILSFGLPREALLIYFVSILCKLCISDECENRRK